ncbi:unnamed protein product [Trichobilharzia regenti]|nr:unnamed protein product [Trichobilharzia regenti]
MDPTERLNSEALLKHAYIEMHNRQLQYYHGELKQMPNAGGGTGTAAAGGGGGGGDGHYHHQQQQQHYAGIKKKPERNFIQNSNQLKSIMVNQLGTNANTIVPRRKYQQQQQQQQQNQQQQQQLQQQTNDRNQTTGTPKNELQSISPTCFASTSITPSFNAGRTNWFVPGIVGQGLYNVSVLILADFFLITQSRVLPTL